MDATIEFFNRLNDQNNANMIQNIQFLQELRNLRMSRKYKVFPRIDPFLRFDDEEFKRRYRMSQQLFNQLFEMLDGEVTLNPLVCDLMSFNLNMLLYSYESKYFFLITFNDFDFIYIYRKLG